MSHSGVKDRSHIVVGTRGSALAQWQADYIIAALRSIDSGVSTRIHIIKTTGDKDQARPLAELGGLGVFTKEIEQALLAHEIDLAVHSLKDLPTEATNGLTIAAIPEREDPRDCLVSRLGLGLNDLPPGARVGTSSTRRSAQVLALRPDLQIIPLRGNVDTRLRKATSGDKSEYDAVILAAAGIIRLGRASEITEYLPLETFLPDPGQGALAVQIRAGDTELAARLAPLDHPPTRSAVTAERAFLQALGGGCRMPVGAYAEGRDGALRLVGMLASGNGRSIARGEIQGQSSRAEDLGFELAERLGGTRRHLHSESLPPKPPSAETSSLLRGRRVLVTRAQEQAHTLSDQIRALGGEPIEFPALQFAPLIDFRELDDALVRLHKFDWTVFTSANGVRFVAERLRELKLDARALASAKLTAIGPATAAALKGLGLHVDFIPTKFLGAQIAVELPVEARQRALLLRADLASAALARGLAARGVDVTDIDAYRTVMPPLPDLSLKQVDAVTFTSSSAVKNLVAMLGSDRAHLDGACVFCIGPVTADSARELGWKVDAVAAEHTVDGLVRAMADYYERRAATDDRRG